MKRNILSVFAVLSLAACGNSNTDKPADSVKTTESINENKFEDTKMSPDADFAVKAADGGMLEVQLGELAQSNATSDKVKSFAKTMIEDHTKVNEELKKLASDKKIALPAELSNDNKNMYEELREKKGNEFDRAYIDHMVKDHEEDIKAFRNESETGNDADLKAWAGGKLPTLEHHLQMAQETQKWVKK